MKTLQIIKYSFLALLAVLVVGFLHYNLPRTAVVQITGTDVKRVDRDHPTEAAQTRDVRYISTVSRNGKVRVFRNEDTGWGWPPYLKFDSADLAGHAQLFMQDPAKPWVRVRYYGWRINIFTLFPNAVSLKIVDRDYTHIPVFNIVLIIFLIGAAFVLWLSIRRLAERLRQSGRFRSISNLFGDDRK